MVFQLSYTLYSLQSSYNFEDKMQIRSKVLMDENASTAFCRCVCVFMHASVFACMRVHLYVLVSVQECASECFAAKVIELLLRVRVKSEFRNRYLFVPFRFSFMDASLHLYKRVGLSVGWSGRPSVQPDAVHVRQNRQIS